MKNNQYILKQCTHLLSCDTSVYSIFAVLSCDRKNVSEEINKLNKGRASGFYIETSEDLKVEKGVQRYLLEFMETTSTESDIMLFADTSEHAELIMMSILKLCAEKGITPIVMTTNYSSEALIKQCEESDVKVIFSDSRVKKTLASLTESMQICHLAYMYNHSVSSIAHAGFGGGFTSPATYYTSLNAIISEKTYNRFRQEGCVDDRRLKPMWTPWSARDARTVHID